mgnify:CR=1 FL=1
MTVNIETIEILWEGPLDIEDIKRLNSESDYGLYQIYGSHAIYGQNTLLYIGKAQEDKFCVRIPAHSNWTDKEYGKLQYYVGRIGCSSKNKHEVQKPKWGVLIDSAERLLIYFTAPSYNSTGLNKYGELKNIVVFNFGKKMLLPNEISTAYYQAEIWDDKNKWQIFNDENK